LLIKPVHYIFIHEVAIKILSLSIIQIFSFLPFLINHFIPIDWHIFLLWLFRNFLNIFFLLPLKLELKPEICIVLLVGLTSHAQIFKGEVSLLMDVSVVVLRYFRSWDVVFRPSTLYS